ncbi:toll-like receptor 1 [Myxocyprinus asiaticus]|uniref:toll-like receptor 1 n=1 Tax=Myxocyprinus asiaticus TaxID=70543 RepID=UPI0022220003|nr:toll-like receptor 1 [Myxocyprinus asiaticus]
MEGRQLFPDVFLVLLLLVNEGRSTPSLQLAVPCSVEAQFRIDLSNHNLDDVPSNLPKSTQYLDLSYNKIQTLSSGALAFLSHLCVLKISHNSLHFISPAAFHENSRLQELDLSFNKLMAIPEIQPLPDLSILDLSENLYGTYAFGKSYERMQSLTFLSVGSPQASVIKQSDFSPLKNLFLKQLILGVGGELTGYEPGSISKLVDLKELTLKMTFCLRPKLFSKLLEDLNETKLEKIILVNFLPEFCHVPDDLTDGFKHMQQKEVTFESTEFKSSVLSKLLTNIIQSPVQSLSVVNMTFSQDTEQGINILSVPDASKIGSLKTVMFDKMHNKKYLLPKVLINGSLFSGVKKFKFSHSGMIIVPCGLLGDLLLEELDVSNNLLTGGGLWYKCPNDHPFPVLKRLILRENSFKDLPFIANKTHLMSCLQALDLSRNSLEGSGRSIWPSHLKELSLSENFLGESVFSHLSPHLISLNLSWTAITTLNTDSLRQLKNLKKLDLSSNFIRSLPLDLSLPALEELHLDNNDITSFQPGTFQGLPKLRKLKAGNNSFICDCNLYWFIAIFNKSLLVGWPLDYKCKFSETLLRDIHLSRISCDLCSQLLVSVTVILFVSFSLGVVFNVLDGAWYIRMLWIWLRVKRRGQQEAGRLDSASLRYHAFISYSQTDVHWVSTQLIPNLEEASFRLCIHEQDFLPGAWIIDNIINCIERSYKMVFVLSQSFVQSEWCNYELLFAQHRALTTRQDSLVFVLLEPIPPDSLPRKFLRLRSLLRKQTYLQWPKYKMKQRIFWASLKTTLCTADMVLNHVAGEIVKLCPR